MQTHHSSRRLRRSLNRRQFLAWSGMAAGGLALSSRLSAQSAGAGQKLNVVCIGAGGKGASDIANCSGENLLAICDVDETIARATLAKYPQARFYKDWRVMLEKEKSAEVVVVSTPDHTHAPAAAAAMRMNKAVYCQKPLTHSIHEARTLRDLAQRYKVVTQMGNQGSSQDGLRRAVEVIQSGLLGPVRNVHIWSNRPIWPQGMDRPEGEDPVPSGLDWDLWLGPAPARPFKADTYHRFKWRGWQDFGTGALGDMACHTANMPFRALQLGYPSSVAAESSGMNQESYPKDSRIHFSFPARGNLVATDLWWYDGGRLPDAYVLEPVQKLMDEAPKSGCMIIGDKGIMFSPDDYGARFFIKLWDEKELTPGEDHPGVAAVPVTVPRNTFKGSADQKQMAEFLAACRGQGECYSSFDIAATLTEVILLGCVALRAGRRLVWKGETMEVTNHPEAAQFIRREYRDGWTL
jgi:hypothetical protein